MFPDLSLSKLKGRITGGGRERGREGREGGMEE
jgi:hypothetical protein